MSEPAIWFMMMCLLQCCWISYTKLLNYSSGTFKWLNRRKVKMNVPNLSHKCQTYGGPKGPVDWLVTYIFVVSWLNFASGPCTWHIDLLFFFQMFVPNYFLELCPHYFFIQQYLQFIWYFSYYPTFEAQLHFEVWYGEVPFWITCKNVFRNKAVFLFLSFRSIFIKQNIDTLT